MTINAIQFVQDKELGPYKLRGNEVEIGCPFTDCPNHGQPQFYININTGSWYCHRCNKKGRNIKQLQFALGFIKLSTITEEHESIVIPEHEVDQWANTLFKTPNAITYLREVRGFEDWVIKQFRLGYKRVHNQDVIVIPYFDQSGTCVGAKYDLFTATKAPKYIKEEHSKSIFYNINNVNLTEPLVITEGEYDAIAGYQYGLENIGSVPNGASSVNGWTEDILAGTKFILCTDNDQAGEECTQRLTKVLSTSKCYRVKPRVKDLSEALQIGLSTEEVRNWFNNEVPMFKPPVLDLTSYKDEALKLITDPLALRGISTGWDVVDDILGGIRQREVTIVSGETGNGKSTFGIALINNLIANGMKCLVLSPEMSGGDLLRSIANSKLRQKVNKENFLIALNSLNDKIQLADFYGAWSENKNLVDYTFDLMDYSVKTFGTNFIMLDHLDCFIGVHKKTERWAEEEEFIKRCINFAIMSGTHIYLVVQPRKPERGQRKISYHDIKGSGLITQITHNILLIHREKNSPLVEFELCKNRRFGKIGSFFLKFDANSMANYEEVKEKLRGSGRKNTDT